MPRRITLLSELAAEHFESLKEQGTARNYPANTILVYEGSEGGSMYLIEEGECKVTNSEDAKDVILGFKGPGEYFGELALLDGGPRSSTVTTTKPSRIRAISASRFHEFLRANPDAAIALLRALSQQVRDLTEDVKSLALKDVYGRVVKVLLENSEEGEGGQIINRRLTHQQIADMVGASREMVTRVLRELTVGGYIQAEKQRILIKRRLPARW